MKRDKNFTWRRVDAASLDLKGMKVAIVGGTGGVGRALSRFMASRGADVAVVGQAFSDSDVSGIEFIKADLSLMREAQRVAVSRRLNLAAGAGHQDSDVPIAAVRPEARASDWLSFS